MQQQTKAFEAVGVGEAFAQFRWTSMIFTTELVAGW
jgi:hypothetical protein